VKDWVSGFRQRLLLFVAEDPGKEVDPEAGRSRKNFGFRVSLRNAIKGIVVTFIAGRNFRIELLLAVIALVLASVLSFSRTDWILLLSNIGLVLGFEVKNSAIELSVDLNTRKFNYYAKQAKDSASGAVLIVAFVSLINGILLFGPPLLRLVEIWR